MSTPLQEAVALLHILRDARADGAPREVRRQIMTDIRRIVGNDAARHSLRLVCAVVRQFSVPAIDDGYLAAVRSALSDLDAAQLCLVHGYVRRRRTAARRAELNSRFDIHVQPARVVAAAHLYFAVGDSGRRAMAAQVALGVLDDA